MFTITERLGIGAEVRELKLGKSFRNAKLAKDSCNVPSHGEAFHTIRYDFKPASVDTTKMAGIEFGENNKVTVTMPNVESSGLPKTVFKGSRKPHQKECVLVIDHETGEITLERLSHNIIVKKIRAEGSCKAQLPRPITPSIEINGKKCSPSFQSNLNTSKPISPKPGLHLYGTSSQPTSLSSLSMMQNGSPSNTKSNRSSPINGLSSINHKSPVSQLASLNHSNVASSINKSDDEMIGILSDSSSDSSDHDSSSSDNSDSSSDEEEINEKRQNVNQSNGGHSSKSDSSESGSDSNSDSEDESPSQTNKSNKVITNGSSVLPSMPNMLSMPKFSQLSVDLQLSESGSDSD